MRNERYDYQASPESPEGDNTEGGNHISHLSPLTSHLSGTTSHLSSPISHLPGAAAVETLLISEVIRHGEEVIYDNIETEDGQTISFNVAQYIDYDLGQDGLQFHHPLYNQILAEAVAHSGDEVFHAMSYFTNHPDIEVSKLATQLAVDRHQLSGRFAVAEREGSLRQRVEQLVMTYRLNLVEARMKAIVQELRTPGLSQEQMMQLLQEHKETKELCEALAKKLGREIIV